MPTPLMKRFRGWLGTWRGPAEFLDGKTGLMQLRFVSIFNGEAIEVQATSLETDGGSASRGWGYISLGRDGRALHNMFYDKVGFAQLFEVNDDPGVLALQGPLPGNMRMDLAFTQEGDELSFSSRIGEGYPGKGELHRTFTRMHRVAPAGDEA